MTKRDYKKKVRKLTMTIDKDSKLLLFPTTGASRRTSDKLVLRSKGLVYSYVIVNFFLTNISISKSKYPIQ